MSSHNGIPLFRPLTIEEDSPYHYRPNKAVAHIFIVLFAISTVLHIGQSIRFRMWWILPTIVLCGALEVLGWSGRLWSSFSPFLVTPFQIQITCTIIAPTPLLAASFVIFGEVIKRLGVQYSRLGAKWYTIIFCTADVVSLVVQGVGGGLAATAETLEGANRGGNIMLGGIAFQLLVIILFSFCMAEYFYRYNKDLPFAHENRILSEKPSSASSSANSNLPGTLTKGLKWLSIALAFSTLVLFVRAIYRTIELSGGWNGPIIKNELLFNVLDGAMVVLAIYTFNVFHPGCMLPRPAKTTSHDGSA